MNLRTEFVRSKRTYIEQLISIVHKGTSDDKEHFILAVQIALEAGSTQAELANALGVDRVNVTRWASGQGASSLLGRRYAWPIIIKEIERHIKAMCDAELPISSSPQPHAPYRAARRPPNCKRQP
jgi:hypothetical protein